MDFISALLSSAVVLCIFVLFSDVTVDTTVQCYVLSITAFSGCNIFYSIVSQLWPLVCLIRVGAKLCRKVNLEGQS